MEKEHTRLGRLLADYLFYAGKTQKQLAGAVGLHRNKLGAAMYGKYCLNRDYIDKIVKQLGDWGVHFTQDDLARLLLAWKASSPGGRFLQESNPPPGRFPQEADAEADDWGMWPFSEDYLKKHPYSRGFWYPGTFKEFDK